MYKTGFGTIVTLVVLTLYLTIAIIKFEEFFKSIDPDQSMTETNQNMLEEMNLNELGFSFAVEDIAP